MDCSMPGFPVYHQLPELAKIHGHWVGDAIQPSCLLSFPSLPAFNISQHQGLFQWVSSSHQVAKVMELQHQHQSFQEYSELVSFRMDWLDLLAIQEPLKSLLQHHSLKASILRHPAFFMVQTSHPYMTTWKTIALTRRTFVSKVIYLLFNMLCSLIITFLPRSKRLLISWLQSPSAVVLKPKKIVSHCFRYFPIYLPWSDGTQRDLNLRMFKLDLEKAEEPEIKFPISIGSSKKQESSREASTSALLTTPKPMTVWITTNCGKFFKRWEYQTTWPASW